MKKLYIVLKPAILCIAVLIFSSCASTTLIQTVPPGAKVYIDNIPVGSTPYNMTDTKIVGTCTNVKLEKEGFETFNTNICRTETVDVGAVIGGLICYFPFLWVMKYNPVHTYELVPLQQEIYQEPANENILSTKAQKLRELKQLLDEGIITQEEFDNEKKKILDEQ